MKLSSKYFIVTINKGHWNDTWSVMGWLSWWCLLSLWWLQTMLTSKRARCVITISPWRCQRCLPGQLQSSLKVFLILRICHKNIQPYSWLKWKFTFVQFFSYRKEFGSNLPGEEIVNRRSQNPWLPLVQAIEQQGQITCIPILWRTLLRPLCLQTKPRYTLSDNNQHHHHENDLSFTIPIKINYWFLWHCICLQT